MNSPGEGWSLPRLNLNFNNRKIMNNSETLYVTDAGSILLNARLYGPGDEIPIREYAGFEAALKEHIQTGKVSRRRKRMRSDESGRVIKMDRSSGAPPLPPELEEYDPRKRREKRPLISEVKGTNEITGALAALKLQQQQDELNKANEAREVDEMVEQAKVDAKAEVEVDVEQLSEIASETEDSIEDMQEDAEDFDEQMSEDDAELLRELEG